MKLWFRLKCWGLINVSWKREEFTGPKKEKLQDFKWGFHLLCFHPRQWYWGRFDREYECIMTYWGLGPLGFISRMNW